MYNIHIKYQIIEIQLPEIKSYEQSRNKQDACKRIVKPLIDPYEKEIIFLKKCLNM